MPAVDVVRIQKSRHNKKKKKERQGVTAMKQQMDDDGRFELMVFYGSPFSESNRFLIGSFQFPNNFQYT